MKIIMTKKEFYKNPNTKTTYILDEETTETINIDTYKLITNEETIKSFRRLGGTETVERRYTKYDYCITQLTSTSPNKQTKIVRTFKFD